MLTQKPEVRIKRLEDDQIKVTRIAEPVMQVNENVVDVNYTVFIEVKATGQVEQVRETHRMRYLFLPEIQQQLNSKALVLQSSREWLTGNLLSDNSWAGFALVFKGA